MAKLGSDEQDGRWIVQDLDGVEGKNVGGYHCEERDVTKQAHADITNMFATPSKLLSAAEDKFALRFVGIGGSVEGDVTVAKRKGKVRCFFDLKLTNIKFQIVRPSSPDEPVGEGTASIAEVDHDTVFSHEYDVSITSKVREAINSAAVSEVARRDVAQAVRSRLEVYFQQLFKHFRVGETITSATPSSPSSPVKFKFEVCEVKSEIAATKGGQQSIPKPLKVEPASPIRVTTSASVMQGSIPKGNKSSGAKGPSHQWRVQEKVSIFDRLKNAPIGAKISVAVALTAVASFVFLTPQKK